MGLVKHLKQVNTLLDAAGASVSAKLYEYALSRPLERGGAPSGFVGHRRANKLITWKWRHGVVQYRHPLSDDQIAGFKLTPLSAKDPAVMDLIYDLVYDDIMDQIVPRRKFESSIKDGRTAVIRTNADTGPGLKWGLEVYNRIGNRVGKTIVRDSVRELAMVLWNMFTDQQKKTYFDVVLYGI